MFCSQISLCPRIASRFPVQLTQGIVLSKSFREKMSQAVEVEPYEEIVENVRYSTPERSKSSSPGRDHLQSPSCGPRQQMFLHLHRGPHWDRLSYSHLRAPAGRYSATRQVNRSAVGRSAVSDRGTTRQHVSGHQVGRWSAVSRSTASQQLVAGQ